MMFTSSEDATAAGFDNAAFRHPFSDAWFSETETLTQALQKSLAREDDGHLADAKIDTPLSSISDPESSAPGRHRNPVPAAGPSGRISKRKSRASKRSLTTFITADPSNFRQMVQQVTGIRFGDSSVAPPSPVLKPEPQRFGGGRLQACLPTLDTSAFSLGHQLQQVVAPSADPAAASAMAMASQLSYPTLECGSLEFEPSFPAFPTLESWRVM